MCYLSEYNDRYVNCTLIIHSVIICTVNLILHRYQLSTVFWKQCQKFKESHDFVSTFRIKKGIIFNFIIYSIDLWDKQIVSLKSKNLLVHHLKWPHQSFFLRLRLTKLSNNNFLVEVVEQKSLKIISIENVPANSSWTFCSLVFVFVPISSFAYWENE